MIDLLTVAAIHWPVPYADAKRYHLSISEIHKVEKAQRWAKRPHAKMIWKRESGGNPRVVNPSSGAAGKWQFMTGTWVGIGGKRFAPRAHMAPEWAQDYMAWRLHKQQGWRPWAL